MTLTPAQQTALDQLPQFYTPRDVVDGIFAGDHDAFVDAWVARALPPAVRAACEQQIPWETQQVWLLQRILAVLQAPQARM